MLIDSLYHRSLWRSICPLAMPGWNVDQNCQQTIGRKSVRSARIPSLECRVLHFLVIFYRTGHSSESMRALLTLFLPICVYNFVLHFNQAWQVVTCSFAVTCDAINQSINILGRVWFAVINPCSSQHEQASGDISFQS